MPLEIDRFAHLASPLQAWDPRIKLVSLGLAVFAMALLQTLPVAIVALSLACLLVFASALPFHFIRRWLAFVALFLAPFVLIMPLSYPAPASLHVLGLPFAWEGLRLATLIFIKALAIVMTTTVVFGTSRFDVSMIALQHLRFPKVIVQMLLFSYRYAFVFLEEMRRMQNGMRVRGFVPRADVYTLRTLGHFVGTLLVRSFERTERVYKAMLSKGYQGEFHTLVAFKADTGDFAKSLVSLGAALALLWVDRSGLFAQAVQGWH